MEDNSQPRILLGIAASGALALVLLLANTGFTVLKEDPLFWRNAGGYSVGLRETVLVLYYPLLGVNCLLCAMYTGLVAARRPVSGHSSFLTIAGAVLLWALLFLNLGLLTANNLQNLINGRPVHYHPPHSQP
jgi:hypothetical protein